jgi:Domain of unknown function (DUF1918)
MASGTEFRAQLGDEIVIRGHTVGDREVSGEILEVLGEPGHEHYRVRWDDGRESILYPGTDAYIKRLGPRKRARARH